MSPVELTASRAYIEYLFQLVIDMTVLTAVAATRLFYLFYVHHVGGDMATCS